MPPSFSTHSLLHLPSRPPESAHRLTIDRTDRWTIAHRLQELQIACWCLEDGSCWVDIPNSTTALLLRSVIHQILAPRQELINWLEQCWGMQLWKNTGRQD